MLLLIVEDGHFPSLVEHFLSIAAQSFTGAFGNDVRKALAGDVFQLKSFRISTF